MPEKVTIHHISGETATMYTLNANEALKNHPDEWSRTPFTAEQRRDYERKQLARAPSRKS